MAVVNAGLICQKLKSGNAKSVPIRRNLSSIPVNLLIPVSVTTAIPENKPGGILVVNTSAVVFQKMASHLVECSIPSLVGACPVASNLLPRVKTRKVFARS